MPLASHALARILYALLPLAALLVIASAAPVLAGPLPVREFLALPTVRDAEVAVSPEGALVAVPVCDPLRAYAKPLAKDQILAESGAIVAAVGCDLWIVDASSGAKRNVTGKRGANWAPSWSPDGKTVAFYSDRDGFARLWTWNRNSGTLRRVSAAPIHSLHGAGLYGIPSGPGWSSDGKRIFTPLVPAGVSLRDAIQPPAAEGFDRTYDREARGHVFSYDPRQKPGSGYAGRNLSLASDLAFVDVATGRANRLVHLAGGTSQSAAVQWYAPSPDGKNIAVILPRVSAAADAYLPPATLRIVSSSGHVTSLAESHAIATAVWSPDSTAIAYETRDVVNGESDSDLYVARSDGAGGARRMIPAGHKRLVLLASLSWDGAGKRLFFCAGGDRNGAGWSIWEAAADGSSLREYPAPDLNLIDIVPSRDPGVALVRGSPGSLVVSGKDGASKKSVIAGLDLGTGKIDVLRREADSVRQIQLVSRDAFLLVREAIDRPPAYYAADASFKALRPLFDFNGAIAGSSFGTSRLIDWQTSAGDRLHGAILLPAGYIEGKRYPTIVYLYGDSALSNRLNVFGTYSTGPLNMQLYASRGYAVLLADTVTHVGTTAQDIADSVIPGVERAIALGIADPDRLAVMGGSYGGFSTMAVIERTHMFKAAVADKSPQNWTSIYGVLQEDGSEFNTRLVETGQGKMGGTLWQYPDRYTANSPIFGLDKITTPLLLLQGKVDPIVPFTEARQAFVLLRRLGKEVTLVEYDGEGHGERLYADQVDYVDRIIDWLDRHLNAGTAPADAR